MVDASDIMCAHVYMNICLVCLEILAIYGLYAEFVSGTYLAITVRYMYNAHCHIFDVSYFIYVTYMCICLLYKPIRYLVYMAYVHFKSGIPSL